MLGHADRGIAALAHAKRHVGIGFGWLRDLKLIGRFVAGVGFNVQDLSPHYIEIGRPDFVRVPGDLAFRHPKWIDLHLMLRTFVRLAALFIGGTSHQKLPSGDRQHFDHGIGMFDELTVRLHLGRGRGTGILDGQRFCFFGSKRGH